LGSDVILSTGMERKEDVKHDMWVGSGMPSCVCALLLIKNLKYPSMSMAIDESLPAYIQPIQRKPNRTPAAVAVFIQENLKQKPANSERLLLSPLFADSIKILRDELEDSTENVLS